MLSGEQNFILYLLRKSLSDNEGDMPEFDDVRAVAGTIVRSSILLTAYPALKSCLEDGSVSDKMKEKISGIVSPLEKMYLVAVRKSVLQDYEGDRVLKALADEGIDCIALKGWELKKFYPSAGMRQMADLDILVRDYDYEKIKSVMEKIGFSAGNESSWKHDSFTKNEILVEMHKRLTDDSGEIRDWEKEMWLHAEETETSHIYRMSDVDYYVFHFVHLHKDFMNGTLGLRRIADTWLLSRQNVDMTAVKTELEKFGMSLFHDRIITLCKACMGEIPMDENSEILLRHSLEFGIYGTYKSYKASRIKSMGNGDAKSGKIRSFFFAIFLPVKRMKAQFPILEKYPVLIPFFWIKRIIRMLGSNVGKRAKLLDYSDVGENELEEITRFFEAGGVEKNGN